MAHRLEPAFSTQFHTLADELFVNRAASGDGFCGYIQSHGFHGRRFLAIENDHPPSDRYAEVDLSDHVREAERLGPYERQVLAEIVHAPHRLVMIVGYAGSGKTSTILHVLEHYARYRVQRVLEHPRPGLYTRVRALQPFQMYVDFEPIWMKVAANSKDDAAARDALLEHWAEALPPAINRMLASTKQPLQLLRDCVATALRWATEQPAEFPHYQVPGALTVFFRKFEGKLSDSENPEDAYRKVLVTLDAMKVEHRIEFWHALLDIVKLHSHPKDIVVAVYDNADPMDAPLQRWIQERLDCIATSCVHKIVAPIRPVTFQVRGFSSSNNWYPHSGPSPVDILSQRLLSFLNRPEQLTTYQDMPRDQAQRALGRALDILARLQRNYGHGRSLGRVLAWMAGDSGRRVLLMAKALFLNDQLFETAENSAAFVRSVRGRYELRAMIDRLVVSLGEEIVAIAEDVVFALDTGRAVGPDVLARRLVDTIELVVANSLRVQNSALLGVSLADVHSVIREAEVGTAARRGLRESAAAALAAIAVKEDNSERRRAVLDAVCRNYRDLVRTCLPKLTWEHRDAAEALSAFVASFAELDAVEPDHAEHAPERTTDPWPQLNKPFMTVQFALRSVGGKYNMFAVGDRPSLCKLHILWFLAGVRRGSATVHDLIATLRALDHTDADILEAVNEFVNEHVRLMWLDRCFAYPSIAALLEIPNHRVVMSRAGWGYQSALTSEIDYLLVHLGMANVNLTTQLHNVVIGLRALHEIEAELRARKTSPPGVPTGVLSPVRDVIVRATAQFQDLAARHFRNLSRNVEREEVRRIVVTYDQLLRDVEFVRPTASTLRPATLRSIDPHQVSLARVDAHRERAMLRSALAGARFWADGMTPDEFRPDDVTEVIPGGARPHGPHVVG